METEIFDETRALGEMKSKLRKVKTTILKKKDLEWNWWTKNTGKTKNKSKNRKTKKSK